LFTLDRFGRTPIYEQLIEQVERRVLDGTLRPQDTLPSVRTLSVSLSINPNTLQKAYVELERRGVCASVPGSGRFVTAEARQRVVGGRRARMNTLARWARELALAAIPLDEVLTCVEEAYQSAAEARSKEGNP
jgi:GntR family transcriptional regulator